MLRTRAPRESLALAFVLPRSRSLEAALADGAFPDSLQFFVPRIGRISLISAVNFGLLISEDDGASWLLDLASRLSRWYVFASISSASRRCEVQLSHGMSIVQRRSELILQNVHLDKTARRSSTSSPRRLRIQQTEVDRRRSADAADPWGRRIGVNRGTRLREAARRSESEVRTNARARLSRGARVRSMMGGESSRAGRLAAMRCRAGFSTRILVLSRTRGSRRCREDLVRTSLPLVLALRTL